MLTVPRIGSLAAIVVLVCVNCVVQAAPPATTRAAGLVATLIANKDTYTLDPAQSGQAFRDKLEAARKANRPAPGMPPKVDLTLRITNNTDAPITLRIGGDESRVVLKLEGPGAVTIPNLIAMTMDFRMGTPVTLEPGKSHDIAITSLAFGMRGVSEYAFWTEPGDYTLAATLVAAEGEGQRAAASEPIKIKVVKANAS